MRNLLIVLALATASFSSFGSANNLIVNFSKVNEGIYRGARLKSVEDAQYLKSINVKNVINLQGGDLDSDIGIVIPWAEPGEKPEVIAWEKTTALSLGLGFYHAPIDSLEEITKEEDKVIDELLEFMHDKNNQPVFIHCEHGADRTGLLVALYRVKYEGADVVAARSEWIKNGHDTLHQLFTGVLDDYYFAKVKEFKK
ncbi:MAG: tyrosine-protein phosphatase [Bacteriovorax sp.]